MKRSSQIASRSSRFRALRVAIFAAPPDRDLDWQDAGVEGISRFLSRVYRYVTRHAILMDYNCVTPGGPPEGREIERPAVPADETGSAALQRRVNGVSSEVEPDFSPVALPLGARKIQRKLHQTIRRVSEDFGGRWHFNTSIAAIMELVNELYAYEESVQRGAEQAAPVALMANAQRNLVLMLAPFAPYMAAELWETLGESSNLLRAPWPKYDPTLAKEEEVEMAVQVNGKIRSHITVPADAEEAQIRETALADGKIKAAIADKEVVKVLVVKGRLVNIVVK